MCRFWISTEFFTLIFFLQPSGFRNHSANLLMTSISWKNLRSPGNRVSKHIFFMLRELSNLQSFYLQTLGTKYKYRIMIHCNACCITFLRTLEYIKLCLLLFFIILGILLKISGMITNIRSKSVGEQCLTSANYMSKAKHFMTPK